MNRVELAQGWARELGYHSVKRPTERAALKLWQTGRVDLRLYFGRYGYLYHNLPLRSRDSELEAPQRTHRKAFGQTCFECGRRKPLTATYWHQDSKQRNGFKSICKTCRKQNAKNKK